MLRLYKDETWSKAQNPEKFFNANIRRFDLTGDKYKHLLYTFGRNTYVDQNTVQTPYGKATLKELPVACKLALCLVSYPSMMFDGRWCSTKDLEKLLMLSDGNILLSADLVLDYWFPIKVTTPERELLTSSTDLMMYLKRGII